jgi:predicted TIM-barrel fold metal-dependent hydrolase
MAIQENKDIERWIDAEDPEPVLEPDLPIIDPHHHLWDLRKLNELGFRQEVYLCEEISIDIAQSGHNIAKTVFAQCGAFYRADGDQHMRCVGETEFANGIAAMSRSGVYGDTSLCAGIFSTADMRLGTAVQAVLEAHLDASQNFRGIRTALPSELNSNFLDAFGVIEKFGLTYDNWSPDFSRLPILAELARRFPSVKIVVNHLGGKIDARASDDDKSSWRSAVETIAECPNAVMKLGGAQMRVGDWEPHFHMNKTRTPQGSHDFINDLMPYYAHAINCFGPERCMFESNFPVDKECISYRTLWNFFKKITNRLGLSDSEKNSVFYECARSTYKL